jgi:uncharacterized protein (UPF0548 family)
MKPRSWRVTQQQIDLADATQRWDQAYQALLTWTAPPLPHRATDIVPNHDAQEVTDAHCPVSAGFDPTPSPEPRA